jgi:transforming growth factor-beta-induced protein
MNSLFKKYTFLSIILLLSFTLVSCGIYDDDDDDVNQTPAGETRNIVEVAVDNGNFTTLVAALQAAELDDDLRDGGPFTVFAPTDDSFAALPDGTIDFLLEPANKSILSNILTYHVLSGDVMADDAIALDGRAAGMLNGDKIRLNVVDGNLVLNNGGNRQATVVIKDIIASNGVIHVIDAVLDPDDAPKDIVETAVENGSFTTLVAALEAAELDDDLKTEGPFTVFAPTDEAFTMLPAGTIPFLLDPANKDALINILTYHVYSDEVYAEDAAALDGSSVTMLNKGSMAIDVVGDSVVLNLGGNAQATVIIKDVIASNGVIHVIDTVLDPEDG